MIGWSTRTFSPMSVSDELPVLNISNYTEYYFAHSSLAGQGESISHWLACLLKLLFPVLYSEAQVFVFLKKPDGVR